MNAKIEGRWTYQSYYNRYNGASGTLQLEVVPWTPPGALSLSKGSDGKLSGSMTFTTSTLSIEGELTPAVAGVAPSASSAGKLPTPEGIRLVGRLAETKYEIRGYFVGPDQIVGTSLCVHDDIAKQPDGTRGPFSLVRVPG
jgi:hypothetical protein